MTNMLMRAWEPMQPMTAVLRKPQVLTMWVGVNAMDVILTFYLLGLGGKEGNPFLAALEGSLGSVGMLGAKLFMAAVVGMIIWRVERRPVLLAAAVLMGLVVIYNALMVGYIHWAGGLA